MMRRRASRAIFACSTCIVPREGQAGQHAHERTAEGRVRENGY